MSEMVRMAIFDRCQKDVVAFLLGDIEKILESMLRF